MPTSKIDDLRRTTDMLSNYLNAWWVPILDARTGMEELTAAATPAKPAPGACSHCGFHSSYRSEGNPPRCMRCDHPFIPASD